MKTITVMLPVAAVVWAFLWYRAWENTDVPEGILEEDVSAVKTFDFTMWLVGVLGCTLEYVGVQPRSTTRRILSLLTGLAESRISNQNVSMHEEEMAGVPVLHFKFNNPEATNAKPEAIIIYFHGGGWEVLNYRFPFALLSTLTDSLRIPSLSVEYRLAPEHPYPAAFEDCLKVTEYVLANHKELFVDPKKVVLAGDSAGGNLAAAVALKLKEKIRLQVLLFPILQAFDFQTPSYREHANTLKHILSRQKMSNYVFGYSGLPPAARELMQENKHVSESTRSKYSSYVHSDLMKNLNITQLVSLPPSAMAYADNSTLVEQIEARILDPLFAPLMADRLDNVADAYVVTGQIDILRDDGIFYCSRLNQVESTTCQHKNYKHAFHGFIHFLSGPMKISSANRAAADLIEHLKTVI